ncbi:hypothetical protein [Thalassotalea agariperforans]
MFKKTLLAAALVAATGSATAGTITISGDAYKVGNEYLNAYTGSALTGDLQAAGIGITYKPGIALGINNTLKFTFSGGAIGADTGLELQKITTFADATTAVAIEGAVDAAIALVANAADNAVDTAALKAAAISAAEDEADNDSEFDLTKFKAAVNALAVDTYANTTTAIQAIEALSAVVPAAASPVADLVDFGTDSNGDYEWVLFKVTDNALTASEVLVFNDTDPDGAANITTKFTKATIGAGDLTVALPEAKDDTGVSLTAPVATAKTLVTTANQFSVTATAVTDTIDVEQQRKYFSDALNDAVTTAYVVDVTVDGTIALGIDETTAAFTAEVTGNLNGVASIAYTETVVVGGDDSGAFDTTDWDLDGVGISDASIAVTVDGATNLATRTLGYKLMINPTEADTNDFYLVGTSGSASDAFIWDLNGSEITFPYAPIGYSHITTNFELANSGDQEGDILLSAFGRNGTSYSGTITQKAKAGSLVKISENDVATALSLPAGGASISLTITTTAPDADIKATGYSNLNSGGRMALLSDAYEGEINP